MDVILGCEESQVICKAFRARGHNAFSCDLKECSGGHPEWHLKMDIFEAIASRNWDMMIAHPPCTYLTVTANKWLKDQPARKSGALVGEERRRAREKAIQFFKDLFNCRIPRVCLENPVGVMSNWMQPSQIIQPMYFGHNEPKKTCLWLKRLPRLHPTFDLQIDPVTHKLIVPEGEYHLTKSGKRLPLWYAYADKSKGQEARATIRSRTFQGIADAMADQWNF